MSRGCIFSPSPRKPGQGSFRLDTSFTATSPLLAPLVVTEGEPWAGHRRPDQQRDPRSGRSRVETLHDTGNSISVYMGNGDGTFQPPEVIEVGAGLGVTVADLTGNGKLDIITAN